MIIINEEVKPLTYMTRSSPFAAGSFGGVFDAFDKQGNPTSFVLKRIPYYNWDEDYIFWLNRTYKGPRPPNHPARAPDPPLPIPQALVLLEIDVKKEIEKTVLLQGDKRFPKLVHYFKARISQFHFGISTPTTDYYEYVIVSQKIPFVKWEIHPPEEKALFETFLEIAQGLIFTAQKGIVLKDIGLNNVLYCGGSTIYFIDFGASKYVGQRDTNNLGTEPFASPEHYLISGIITNPKSDIYSAAMLVYSLAYFFMSGYSSLETVLPIIPSSAKRLSAYNDPLVTLQSKYPNLWKILYTGISGRSCLALDFKKRPTADELLKNLQNMYDIVFLGKNLPAGPVSPPKLKTVRIIPPLIDTKVKTTLSAPVEIVTNKKVVLKQWYAGQNTTEINAIDPKGRYWVCYKSSEYWTFDFVNDVRAKPFVDVGLIAPSSPTNFSISPIDNGIVFSEDGSTLAIVTEKTILIYVYNPSFNLVHLKTIDIISIVQSFSNPVQDVSINSFSVSPGGKFIVFTEYYRKKSFLLDTEDETIKEIEYLDDTGTWVKSVWYRNASFFVYSPRHSKENIFFMVISDLKSQQYNLANDINSRTIKSIEKMVISDNDKTLYATGKDDHGNFFVAKYDIGTRKEVLFNTYTQRAILPNTNEVYDIKVSKDDKYLFILLQGIVRNKYQNILEIRDGSNFNLIAKFIKPTGGNYARKLDITPNEKYIFLSGVMFEIDLAYTPPKKPKPPKLGTQNIVTMNIPLTLQNTINGGALVGSPGVAVKQIQFLPLDSRYMAILMNSNELCAYDNTVANAKIRFKEGKKTASAYLMRIRSICFSNKRFVCNSDNEFSFYKLHPGTITYFQKDKKQSYYLMEPCNKLAITSNNMLLAGGSDTSTISIYDNKHNMIDTYTLPLKSGISDLQFGGDGKTLLAIEKLPQFFTPSLNTLSVRKNKSELFSGNIACSSAVWRNTKNEFFAFNLDSYTIQKYIYKSKRYSWASGLKKFPVSVNNIILSMSLTTNDNFCAVVYKSGDAEIFETATWGSVQIIPCSTGHFTTCKFSNDNKYLALGISAGKVELWG